MFKLKKFLISLSTGVALVAFGIQPVGAIEYGMLGGKPANPDPSVENSGSWFIYNLEPGESKEDALLVMNLFEESFNILIYAADTTKSSGGGFALKQYSEPKEEVGSWVKFYPEDVPKVFQGIFEKKEKKIIEFCKLNKEELQNEYGKDALTEENFAEFEKWCQGDDHVEKTMGSKEKSTLPFVISIPSGADVGEHTGGILIQKVGAENTTDAGGSAVKLTTRVGIRIYETVPGEIIKKIVLEEFKAIKNFKEFDFASWFGGEDKPEEYLVQSKIRSESNVSIDNENVIHVKDLLFGKRNEEVVRNFQVLKNDIFISNYSWSNPRFGHFSFQTEIKYKDVSGQEQKIVSDEIRIWIMPWREISFAIFGLLVLGLSYFGWRRYQKKKYGGVGWVKYVVKKADTLAKLAEKYEVNWLVLAKTNRIKAPYILKVGSVILVPGKGKSQTQTKAKKGVESEDNSIVPAEEEEVGISEESSLDNESGVEESLAEMAEEISPSELGNVEEEIVEKKSKQKKPVARMRKNAGTGNEKKVDALMAKLSRKIGDKPAVTEKDAWSRKKIIWIMGVVALGICIIALGVFWVLDMNKKKDLEIQEKNSIIAALENARQSDAVPEKKLDEKKAEPEQKKAPAISEIKISVLNESGVAGAAGKVKEFLVEKGYAKTEAGNGESEDTTGSKVFYKSDEFQKEAEWIGEMLKGKNIEVKISKAGEAQQASADIVIVLGK